MARLVTAMVVAAVVIASAPLAWAAALGDATAPFIPAAAVDAAAVAAASSTGRRLQQQASTCASQCQGQLKIPVCDGKRSWDNLCLAECAKAQIKYWGACKPKPCLCSFGRATFWEPVCSGSGRSFVNKCFAQCSGARSTRSGFCSSTCKCGGLPKQPVCGMDGRQYDNQCRAFCAGTQPYYSGSCDKRISTCACPSVNDPVCVKTFIVTELPGLGTIRTPVNVSFSSPCLARCEGRVTTWSKGACQGDDIVYEHSQFGCGCSFEINPVCAQSPVIRQNVTIYNACAARCVGFRVLYAGTCRNECLCPPAPFDGSGDVCAGGKRPYKSACQARCAGEKTWTPGKCAQCAKPCPLPTSADDVVCGSDGLPYPTECNAVCSGVKVAYKGICKGLGGKK